MNVFLHLSVLVTIAIHGNCYRIARQAIEADSGSSGDSMGSSFEGGNFGMFRGFGGFGGMVAEPLNAAPKSTNTDTFKREADHDKENKQSSTQTPSSSHQHSKTTVNPKAQDKSNSETQIVSRQIREAETLYINDAKNDLLNVMENLDIRKADKAKIARRQAEFDERPETNNPDNVINKLFELTREISRLFDQLMNEQDDVNVEIIETVSDPENE